MRSFLAGLIFFSVLALSFTPSAVGQVDGQVLGLGFNDTFRPDCWTPLKVQLHNRQNDPKNYMIQVHQQDLDKDTVVFTRVVPLGPGATTDYWVYFIPQPTGGGLTGGQPLAEVLKVYLYDESGRTLLSPLPITFPIPSDVDPPPGGTHRQGHKLVLGVIANDSPSFGEYDVGALGLMERVDFLTLHPDDLPASVLGYQGVDAVVWFDAEAKEVSSGGTGAFEAIQQYVKEGGQLVICQPAQRGAISAFADADMLPVLAKDGQGNWVNDFKAAPKADMQPLYDLAVNPGLQDRTTQRPDWQRTTRDWDLVKRNSKSLDMYRARARKDAVVDLKIHWGDAPDGTPDETPYVARRAYGTGSVAWVAQDLGSPFLTSVRRPGRAGAGGQSLATAETGGWPYVWDRVFGWNNRTIIKNDWLREDHEPIKHDEYRIDGASAVELGASLAQGMDASARGAWLVTVAIFFFIVYWIVAGPGSYFFLAQRKRKGLSWTVFAAAALVATAVTVGVVKLVLRGEPEVHHVTVMRLAPEEPVADAPARFSALAASRFGLYIPRDGEQTVELTGASDKEPSYVIPLTVHQGDGNKPDDAGFTDTQTYAIPTDNLTKGDVSVNFPFRSTLKKIESRWVGSVAEGITGNVQFIDPYYVIDPADPKKQFKIKHGPLIGVLTNATGRDLHDVYLAYRYEYVEPDRAPQDYVLYVRSWPKGGTIDLDVETRLAGSVFVDTSNSSQSRTPANDDSGRSLVGRMSDETGGWYDFWVGGLAKGGLAGEAAREDDSNQRYLRSLPLMAFIDRVPPFRGQREEFYRAELLRHGGRVLNMSQAVACGRLVILAQAEGPVPFPLKVNGTATGGEGVTFYEVSLPIDYKIRLAAATRPSTRPTTAPATAPAGGTVAGAGGS